MLHDVQGAQALDYQSCLYGTPRLWFRGPKRAVEPGSHIAVMGGSETYGKYVARPYPDLLEDRLGLPVVNLGVMNAGVDAFLHAPQVMSLAGSARVAVVQVMGAQALSNRFYRVHPRRNDRFLGPSALLSALFREVDFTEFSFTRHMLSTLAMVAPDRFALVREELRAAWLARMRLLIRDLGCPVVLLWLREDTSGQAPREVTFVGADMIDDLSDRVAQVIEVPLIRAGDDLEGMVVPEMDMPAARRMPSLAAHRDIAHALAEALEPMIRT